jgi:hypothetical protein
VVDGRRVMIRGELSEEVYWCAIFHIHPLPWQYSSPSGVVPTHPPTTDVAILTPLPLRVQYCLSSLLMCVC